MKFASDLRKQARQALRGNWFIAIIAGFIASFFGATTFGGSSFSLSGSNSSSSGGGTGTGDVNLEIEKIVNFLNDKEILPILITILLGTLLAIFAISLVQFLFGGAVGIGYSKINLDIIDGNRAKLGTLFGSFNVWTKALVARILRAIYVTLWSFLFIIPGIIASYSYSMVHYVMADNPDMTASEALQESKEIMKGNKWRLFCLALSFIGWEILAVIFTLGIGLLWVVPYQEAAIAALYRDICPVQKVDTTTNAI